MTSGGTSRSDELLSSARRLWRGHGNVLLWLAVVVSGLAATIRVGHGLLRLSPLGDWRGGIDLRFRWHEVASWFDGLRVYGRLETADYPPASYVLLWPFLGGVEFGTARWIWAALCVVLLAAFAWVLWKESEDRPMAERAWLAALPLAGYATHGMLVTGQVTALSIVCVVIGTFILVRGGELLHDLLGAALVIVGLVKPTLGVPLVWVAVLAPRRWRPALFIGGGYAAITIAAAAFQPDDLLALVAGWLGQSDDVNLRASYGNVQWALGHLGMQFAFLPVALAIVALSGYWVYRHRSRDPWQLLGAMAIVARLLTYHRSFDDLLLVLPIVALARIAARRGGRLGLVAGALAVALWLGALAPRFLLANASAAIASLNLALPALWVAALACLCLTAERERATVLRERVQMVRARLVAT